MIFDVLDCSLIVHVRVVLQYRDLRGVPHTPAQADNTHLPPGQVKHHK